MYLYTFDDILEEALCSGGSPQSIGAGTRVSQIRQSCGWNLMDTRKITVPLVNTSGVLVHSQCEQYDLDRNNTGLTCDNPESDLTDDHRRKAPMTSCKEGWEKKNFLMSNLLNGILGILVACSPNWVSMLVFRAFYGFGDKVTELVGVEYKRTAGVIYQMFFSVGILILPLISYFITDWRWLQVVITAPYILFLFYYCFLYRIFYSGFQADPRVSKWLHSQHNAKKAVKITEAIPKENKKTLSKNIERRQCRDLNCLIHGPNQNSKHEKTHLHPYQFQLPLAHRHPHDDQQRT
ncbi:unnamed protein product [Coregonus sp. 'balchen']|nr:unnamed protein product [Coregonus sp. 'balchen']